MCVVRLFSIETGEELKGPIPLGQFAIAVGTPLQREDLKNRTEISFEIARVSSEGSEGYEIYEVVSDREVKGTFEEVRNALQELGFTLLDWVYRKMFENIQASLGLPKEQKST